MVYLIEVGSHRQCKLQVLAEETASVEDEKLEIFIRRQNFTALEIERICR